MKRNGLVYIGWFFLIVVLAACATTTAEQNKKESEAYRRVGEAYLQQSNLSLAMKEFKKAEVKYADDHLLQYDLGLVYLSKKHYDPAIVHFKRALNLKPDYGEAINSLGNAYAGKGDWDQAIFYYKKVVSDILYGTPHYGYSNLGNAYYYKKDLELSEKYYLEALSVKPDFTTALQGLARTYIGMGRIPQAVAKLERAVRKAPDSPAIHFQLAKAYQLALEFEKAYNSYRKVVELAPDSSLADQAEEGAEEVKALF
ncbi:MAG: tetratricopeptide repeat protein [Desulfobacterales bacterium]|jgi:Tfp pilus assembly protein PilF